jgi:cytochrome c biogenesis protein CcmG/thiol:disulfide interchange protein DsbE
MPNRFFPRASQKLTRLLASILVAMLLFTSIAQARPDTLVVGKPAPSITLTTLDGARLATDDLLGKVIIVTFWATWCNPCREELPLLSTYATAHASQGLVVLGFSLDAPDKFDEVRSVARQLNFPVGVLGDSRVSGYGRIWRLPVSFTIDRKGRLVDNGWDDKNPVWTRESLERVVTPLLGQGD